MSGHNCPHITPPGLVGEIAQAIYDLAPYPNRHIALPGAVALMSGICGRSYNTHTGAGLNQYIMVTASTGMGKDAAASAVSKLLAAVVEAGVVSATGFKGPRPQSAPGLLKHLSNHSSVVCLFGEFGHALKQWTSPKAGPNDTAMLRTVLELYSLSGAGNVIDGLAYSDATNNTKSILSPALTIFGESVPGVLHEGLDEASVASGLLPRFLTFEVETELAVANPNMASRPCPNLVQKLAELCAHSEARNRQNRPVVVAITGEAEAFLSGFDAWTRREMFSNESETCKQLWNRAHLKAMKLAALVAVGMNYHGPLVTIDDARWAVDLVYTQTNSLLIKFENSEVGRVAGNQSVQERELRRIIRDYITKPWAEKYHGGEELHSKAVITRSHISQKLAKLKAFAEDPRGAKDALDRTIKSFVEGDHLQEMARSQMVEEFGNSSRAYFIKDFGFYLKMPK